MATNSKKHGITLVKLLVVILILFMFVLLFLPLLQPPYGREAGRRMQCATRQKNIAIALLTYENTYNQFPPAYVADKEGKPLYSWRVLILPFLEQKAIYDNYHLDEPWDSPHNKKLSETAIPDFQCSSCQEERPGMTNYVLVTGPGTIWEEKETCSYKKIRFPWETIMLLEVNTPDIHWAEPKDLEIDKIDPSFLDEEGDWRSIHPAIIVATFADGRIECIPNNEILDSLKIRSQIKTASEWTKREEQEANE